MPDPSFSRLSPEEAADRLRAIRTTLAAPLVDRLEQEHPEWGYQRAHGGREGAIRLAMHHLDTLEVALRSGMPDLSRQHAAWLAQFLAARGVPAEAVRAGGEALAALLAERLEPEAHAPFAPLLAAFPPSGAEPAPRPASEGLPKALLAALLAGEDEHARTLLSHLLRQGMDVARLADEVVQPAMAELGLLWLEARVSEADEHAAALALERALDRALLHARLHRPAQPPPTERILVACVEGSRHSVGSILVAGAFAEAGWRVRHLGADVPTRALVDQALAWSPKLVALSIPTARDAIPARQVVDALRAWPPGERPRLVIGGGAIREHPQLAAFIGADEAHDTLSACMEAHQDDLVGTATRESRLA